MVWLNYQCDNRPAGKGKYGGAICMCSKCLRDRKIAQEELGNVLNEENFDEEEHF